MVTTPLLPISSMLIVAAGNALHFLNDLSTWADHRTDHIVWNFDHLDTWRIRRQFLA
jgi:hypothetical protein